MKLTITKKYYKQTKTGREPIKYKAKYKEHYDEKKKKWIAHEIKATVFVDPVLKKHPDLLKVLMKHEKDEIKASGSGSSSSHSSAKKREPKAIRNIGGVSGFWKEIKRREKKAK